MVIKHIICTLKTKNKKWFCRSCLQCFSDKNVLTNHKENCFNINGIQSVKLEKGIIADKYIVHLNFMLILSVIWRRLKFMKSSIKKKYHNHISCSFAYKVVCIDDRFSKPTVFFRGENAAYEFIKAILKEYEHCKKVMKKHFNKNLIINEEEEEQYQSSNSF